MTTASAAVLSSPNPDVISQALSAARTSAWAFAQSPEAFVLPALGANTRGDGPGAATEDGRGTCTIGSRATRWASLTVDAAVAGGVVTALDCSVLRVAAAVASAGVELGTTASAVEDARGAAATVKRGVPENMLRYDKSPK